MNLDNLLDRTCVWLQGEGQDNDIVVSGRIPLARNVVGFPFVSLIDDETSEKLEEHIRTKIFSLPALQDFNYCVLNELSAVDCYLLLERHLISR